jgi:membrane protein DedA with SNARE-associated domain
MLHLLLTYAYQAMIPLSLIEGPIVAVAAGAGVATGKINPAYAALIIAFGAFFQDTVYYWLGRWAQSKPKVRAFATRARLLRDTVQPLEAAWRSNMFVTLVSSKFAYGLYGPILVTAGMACAPFAPFLLESLALSAVVLGAWFGVGVGLEHMYGALGHENYASYAIAGVGVLGLVALFFIGRHARERLDLAPARPDNK